jgi:cholesterol transport system auxiliary component
MKRGMAKAALVALCAILFSGCALLSPVDTAARKYVLSSIPLDLPSERTRSATLLVLVPETHPVYRTTQMAYATQAHQIAYFSRNEWAETPAQMVLPLIVKTILSTHYFSEVRSPPHFGRHTFALRTEILELKQDFTSDPALLQLTMRFHLSREGMNRVIATKEVSVREPLRERNPAAGVAAANEAAVKVLRELARFVVEKAR